MSPAVFDAALSCSASNAEGTSPWLLELKEDHGSDDDDKALARTKEVATSSKLRTRTRWKKVEVQEEYEAEDKWRDATA